MKQNFNLLFIVLLISYTNQTSLENTGVEVSDSCKEKFKSQILEGHNKYRLLHKVESLVWNDELAVNAEKYVEYLGTNNLMTHSAESEVEVGENLYLTGSLSNFEVNDEFCSSKF